MKWVLSIAILFSFYACTNSETKTTENKSFTYIHTAQLNKKDLYNKIMVWMAKTYNSAKDVIQLQNPESGQIIGKGVTSFLNIVVEIPCEYTISIDIKDKKYRVIFEQFTALWGEHHNMPQPVDTDMYLEQLEKKMKYLSDNLDSFINENKKDDF